MRCVTNSQLDEWLSEQSIPKDPYHGDSAPGFYLQFYAPLYHRRIDAFIRNYYDRIVAESDSLIHMTDWGLYQQSEMIAIAGIRSNHGETRRLIDTPGHILTPIQQETGISLFGLAVSFAWSAHLYSPKNRSTLFNWKGEIFDFWTDSAQAMTEMKLMLDQFDLNETSKERQHPKN